MRNIILFGAPGSGKGTLSNQILEENKNFVHLAPGDLLRDNIQKETELGLIAKEYVENGKLVPSDLIESLIRQFILNAKKQKKGILFDGYPRSLEQKVQLEKIFTDFGLSITDIFWLDVSLDEVLDRILNRILCTNCGAIYNLKNHPPKNVDICDKCKAKLVLRKDDNEETIKTRFNTYLIKTLDLKKAYENHPNFHIVDANLGSNEVHKQVNKFLNQNNEVN